MINNPKVIAVFDGTEYDFLSNFYYAPIIIDNERWSTSEHFYQAMKSIDERVRKEIQESETPGDAKRLGRKCVLRPGWEELKFDVMLTVLRAKFSQHEDLRKKLLDTGDSILVEGNKHHDNIYGVCFCKQNNCTGIGQNMLGNLLMKVRTEIKNNTDESDDEIAEELETLEQISDIFSRIV